MLEPHNQSSDAPVEQKATTDQSQNNKIMDLQHRLMVAVLTLLLAFLIFQVGFYFADILRILGISILLSYLFINIVDFGERYLRNRAVAILFVYGILGVVIVFGIILVVPAMVYQISQLIDSVFAKLPELLTAVTQALTPLEARLQAAQINVRAVDIVTGVISSIPKPEPGAVIGKISEMTMSTMTWVLYAISIFVVSFYFLLEGHSIKDAVITLFPRKYHNALQLMTSDMDNNLQAFFRGQVVLALLAGLVMLGVYVLFGVQYALLLSVFLAVWEVVPVIGPPIGFAPAIIAVAIQGMTFPGNRIVQIIVLTLVFNVLQQLKDNVIAPRYIGNVIGLHPILIFVAIMIGARMDGMLGIIFALPMACVVNVFLRHLPLNVTYTTVLAKPETE